MNRELKEFFNTINDIQEHAKEVYLYTIFLSFFHSFIFSLQGVKFEFYI